MFLLILAPPRRYPVKRGALPISAQALGSRSIRNPQCLSLNICAAATMGFRFCTYCFAMSDITFFTQTLFHKICHGIHFFSPYKNLCVHGGGIFVKRHRSDSLLYQIFGCFSTLLKLYYSSFRLHKKATAYWQSLCVFYSAPVTLSPPRFLLSYRASRDTGSF